jgi:FAD dependent oxidoreductase TIGR03364
MQRYDDAVIGAGILGLAHAYHLARRGRRVIVFERDHAATGASVRNFGMLWPIGQPSGQMRALARRSLAYWLEVLASAGLWHARIGCLHLAYRDDEARILEQFVEKENGRGERYELLDSSGVRGLASRARQDGLRLALWSPEEVCVDPREVVARLPAWLAREHGVVFRFASPVTDVRTELLTAMGDSLEVGRVWICSGDELRLLFPQALARSGLIRCKLQMMRSQAFGTGSSIGPMLAAGLTLRHYAAFRDCTGLEALENRVARESPWFDRYGIHVLVSQNGHGELTIGDSHEYGPEIDPFDKAEIEEWILDYLWGFLDVPDLRIASRWHGTYAKHPEHPFVILRPVPGVRVITGVGGAGMTLSFGLAEMVVEQVLGSAEGP